MSNTTCYRWMNHPIISGATVPIVPPEDLTVPDESQIPCVFAGYEAKYCCMKGDTCLEGSVCKFTPSHFTESGYYLGGCVDDAFADSACSFGCYGLSKQDIVWNSTDRTWSCCASPEHSDLVNCLNPNPSGGFYNFDGTPPENLIASLIPLSTASTSKASSSSFISTSAAVTDTPKSSQLPPVTSHKRHSGLTVGARAGIGIASVVGGLAALAAIYFLIRRSRKKSHMTHALAPNAEYPDQAFTGGKPELETRESMLLSINELDATEPTQAGKGVGSELNAGMRSELDAETRSELDAGMRSEPGMGELVEKKVMSSIEAPGKGAGMRNQLDVGNPSGESPATDLKAAVVDTDMRDEQDGAEKSGKEMRTA